MIAALAGTELPADTLDALVARADGVPLYVEELTKAVVEPGAARERGGDSGHPRRLTDGAARSAVDGEGGGAAGGGAGTGVRVSPARGDGGLDEAALRHGLARLVEAEIVFVRGEPPAATYTFKHALVQEAAYESLLKRTRQQLHGRVVDVLVAAFPERAAAEPEVVARHAEVAGRLDDAIAYYQRAGEQAQARSAHEEAIRAPAPRDRAARDAARGRGTRRARGGAAAGARRRHSSPRAAMHTRRPRRAYERARVLCEDVGDADRLGLALIGLATFCLQPRRDRARAACWQPACSRPRSRAGRRDGAPRTRQVAIPEHYQGKFASSLAHCEAARASVRPGARRDEVLSRAGYDRRVARTASPRGTSGSSAGRTGARPRQEAVGLARQLDHPFSLAFALFFADRRPLAAARRARPARAGAEVIALSEAQGFPLWLGVGNTFHAAARVAAGEHAGACRRVRRGARSQAETGSQAGAPAIFALLAEAYRPRGSSPSARRRRDGPGGSGADGPALLRCGAASAAGRDRLEDHRQSTARVDARRQRRSSSTARSTSRARRRRSPSSCAPRPAWRDSGAIRASAPKRAPCSPRSTPGSPKASTRATCRTRRRCWRSCGRGGSLGRSWRDHAAFAFVRLTLPSCWTPSMKPMPPRTSGRRWAPFSRRHRACAKPVALLAGLRPHVADGRPEPEGTIAHGNDGRAHAPPLQVAKHGLPALRALAVAVLDRDQLLRAVGPHANHHECAEAVVLQPDVEVDAVDLGLQE